MSPVNSGPLSPFRSSFAHSHSFEVADRRWLRGALATAALLHLLALFVPIPSPRPAAPQEPDTSPPQIVPAKLRPPEMPENSPRDPVARERRAFLPVPVPADHVEPLSEEPVLPEDPDHSEWEIIIPEPERPPAVGPMSEETPGLVLPVPLPGRAKPEYPEVARKVRLQGRVKLKAVVDEQGRVRSIRVLEAPEADLGFSRSAVEAVSGWLYEPGRYRGSTVAVEITVIVEFVLQ